MKKLLDTRVKQITAGGFVLSLVICSGVGAWALTNKGNAVEDTPVVELTDADKAQLEREEKFNDFLITEAEIKIVEGTLDFDFSKVIQPEVDKVEVEGFDLNKVRVQEGTITATVGSKKLSKPLTIEVIAKEDAAEATKVTEVKFDEAKVKEVETGKVVSKDVADKVKPTTPNNNGNGGTATKPTPVIETKDVKTTEAIAFKTEERANANMLKGQTRVVQDGVNGILTKTIRITYTDGVKTHAENLRDVITKQAVNKIVENGTKEEVKAPTMTFNANAAGYFTSDAAAQAWADSSSVNYDWYSTEEARTSDGKVYWAVFLIYGDDNYLASKGWSGTRTFTVSGTTVIPN